MSRPHTSPLRSSTAWQYTVALAGSRMASVVSRLPSAWRTEGMRPEVSRPAGKGRWAQARRGGPPMLKCSGKGAADGPWLE